MHDLDEWTLVAIRGENRRKERSRKNFASNIEPCAIFEHNDKVQRLQSCILKRVLQVVVFVNWALKLPLTVELDLAY